MDFLIVLFFDVIYQLILGSIGAFIRSLFIRERSFKELLDDKPLLNATIAFVIIAGIVLTYIYL